MARALLAGQPAPPSACRWVEVAQAAYALCHTQTRVGFSGITGLDYQGCALALRSHGTWWDERRCVIPWPVLRGLQVIESVMIEWKTCPECAAMAKGKPKVCSVCGCEFFDGAVSAADELRYLCEDGE